MVTVLVYIPATGRSMPVMVPERILEGRRQPSLDPPGKQTHSAKSKQRVELSNNFKHNQANCALYRLPNELHDEIAKHLPGPDLLHYAHSSRRTSFLMHMFVTKPRFRVCEHKSYSPEGLERAMWSRAQIHLRVTLCDKHLNREAGILGPELGMVWDQGTFVAVFMITHILCQLPRDPAGSADTIQTALKQLAIHICPHLNSADELVWDALKPSLGHRNGEVVATCTQCGAAYGMVREAMGMGVALNVQRRVRNLEDPDSQEVLKHLEDCSPRIEKSDHTQVLDVQRRVRNLEEPNSQEVLKYLKDRSFRDLVMVNDNVQREEQGAKKRIRGLAEWTVGLLIGLIILAFIWNWVRNVPVRKKGTPQRRENTQANDTPLLSEVVDKRKTD